MFSFKAEQKPQSIQKRRRIRFDLQGLLNQLNANICFAGLMRDHAQQVDRLGVTIIIPQHGHDAALCLLQIARLQGSHGGMIASIGMHWGGFIPNPRFLCPFLCRLRLHVLFRHTFIRST